MTDIITVTYESARCWVRPRGDGTARLTNLWSDRPGLGHASKLMGLVVEWAEAELMVIDLTVQRYGGRPNTLSSDELVVFYEKFGFEEVEYFPVKMVRFLKGENDARLHTPMAFYPTNPHFVGEPLPTLVEGSKG